MYAANARRLYLVSSGLLVASGLWLIDEILTLALYCGRTCLYPFPGGVALPLYDAESVAWSLILLGFFLLLLESLITTREKKESGHQE